MSQLMSVRRIAVALRLMDSFTGQVPTGANLWVAMADGALPVRKPDGYYIFWDNGKRERTLMVSGPGYEPENICLDMEKLALRRQPTFCLWLKPDSTYAYPAGTWFEGIRIQPGTMREVLLKQSSGCIRLAEAYPMDSLEPRRVHLLAPEDMELENRRLYIEDMGGDGEYCTVWAAENRAMGIYLLEKPLKRVYGPYDSRILLTMVLRADNSGCLSVPAGCSLD